MQYFIWAVLILLGVFFVKSKAISVALLIFDWIIFSFNTGNADYSAYQQIYRYANFNISWKDTTEIGFRSLCVIARDYLGLDYQGFRILISTVSLILLYLTIVRYTNNSALVLSLFSIYPMVISVVQLRNWVAFSLVLFSVRFLEKQKISGFLKYGLCVLLATLMHYTSIFYILIVIFLIIDEKKLYTAVISWCIFGSAFVMPIGRAITRFLNKGMSYFGDSTALMSRVFMYLYIITLHILICEIEKIVYQGHENGHFTTTTLKYQNFQAPFLNIAKKFSLLSFVVVPFASISGEFTRYLRHIAIIEYILISIPASVKIQTRKQYLIRLIVLLMVSVMLIYLECISIRMFTVFKPCFENNSLFELLF